MAIYETVKGGVTVRDAADRYGIDVGHNNMALCPFHNDHDPSLFVADDHYHCYGCGEHGDVIDFAAKLFDCRLHEATLRLAADFGIKTDDTGQKPKSAIPSSVKKAQQFREKERLCFSVCLAYVRLMEKNKARYAPEDPDDEPDNRFTEACHKLEQYEYYTELLTSSSGDERTELAEYLIDSGKIAELQKRLKKEWIRNDRFDYAV